MKRTSFNPFLVVIFVVLFSGQIFAQQNQTNWEAFSENLEVALRYGNTGLRQSAMQRIITYSDNLTLDDGVYRIGRIFQYGADEQESRLALIALAKINSTRSMAYIYEGLSREQNEAVRNQGYSILNDFILAHSGTTEDDLKFALEQDK